MTICKNTLKMKILLMIVFFILASSVSSVDDLLGFQANIYDSNGNLVSNGDIGIEIWDSATGGSLIYNSTDNFIGNISNGKVDIVLGEISSLNLDYGKDYYMEIYVNYEDLDFSGNERRRFQASIGNITSSYISPSNITNSLIANAAITAAKVLDNTLTELDILNGNLTSTVIADIFVKNTGDDVDGDLTVGGGYSNSGITLENGTGDVWVGGDIFVDGELVRVDSSQINGSILFSKDEVFTIGNTTDKAAFIYTRDINVSGTIYSLINSAERSINSWIETIISDNQANATKLDETSNNLQLNSTALESLKADAIANSTKLENINTTANIGGIVNETGIHCSIIAGEDADFCNDATGGQELPPDIAYLNESSQNFTQKVTFGSDLWIEQNLNVTGTIYTIINSIEQNLNILIETIISDNQANATLLDRVSSDLNLNSTAFLDTNSTQGIQQLINDTDVKFSNLEVTGKSTLGSFTIDDELIIGNHNISSTDVNFSDGSNEGFFYDYKNNRVGIGTTSPLTELEVLGNPEANLTLSQPDGSYVSGDEVGVLEFYGRDTSGGGGVAGILAYIAGVHDDDNGEGESIAGSTTEGGRLVFYTGKRNVVDTAPVLSEAMRIDNDGKVGIGTTAPTSRLHVYDGDVNFSTGDGVGFFYQNSTKYVGIGTTSPGAKLEVVNGDVNFSNGTDPGFFFDESENMIGIGTANPSNKLMIRGDTAQIRFYDNAKGVSWDIGPQTGQNIFEFKNNGGTPLNYAFTNGNVGIGTVGPTSKLHVYDGDVNFSTGAVDVNSGSLGFFYENLTGRVGIGTGSPASLLEIRGSTTVKTIQDMLTITNIQNSVDMDGTGSAIHFNQYSYNPPTKQDAGEIAVVAETDWTATASTQDSYMAFHTALDGTVDEKVRITSDGKVGINTTSPTHALNVVGDINATGDIYMGWERVSASSGVDVTATAQSVGCSSGKQVIGGGCYCSNCGTGEALQWSYPSNSTSWECWYDGTVTITAYAICANMK